MEFTVPFYESYQQGDLSRDVAMRRPQNVNSSLKSTILLEKPSYDGKGNCKHSHALFAVKQDPAVLEAQVTVSTRQDDSSLTSKGNHHNEIIIKNNRKTQATAGDVRIESGEGYKAMLSMQCAALQSLSTQQFELLMKYVSTLRKQRLSVQKQMTTVLLGIEGDGRKAKLEVFAECGFCKNNGHPAEWYSTHSLKDSRGRVRCPILRVLCCRRCGATGDRAHTVKYCPEKHLNLSF